MPSKSPSRKQGKVSPQRKPSRSRSASKGRKPEKASPKAVERKSRSKSATRAKAAQPVAVEHSQPASRSDVVDAPTKPAAAHKTHKVETTPSCKHCGPVAESLCLIFLALAIPAAVFYINLACRKKECVFLSLPNITFTYSTFITAKSFAMHSTAFLALIGLSSIPIGRMITVNGVKYCLNGAAIIGLLVPLFGLGVHYFDAHTYLRSNWYHVMTSALILSFIGSIIAAFVGRKASPSELSPSANGRVINDWFFGRQLYPLHCPYFDLKIYAIRLGCWLWLFTVGSVLVEHVKDEANWQAASINWSLVFVCLAQTVYLIDFMIFEEEILMKPDMNKYGIGFVCWIMCLLQMPFGYSLNARYMFFYKPTLECWQLAIYVVLFGLGYWFYRASNLQKHQFRVNPQDPRLAHLESIATPDGRRLLVSGWWGWVRHPNYLGDILMTLSWTLPCGFRHFWPWLPALFVTSLLVARTNTDGRECARKHGAAFARYCERVKYRLLPYVY